MLEIDERELFWPSIIILRDFHSRQWASLQVGNAEDETGSSIPLTNVKQRRVPAKCQPRLKQLKRSEARTKLGKNLKLN